MRYHPSRVAEPLAVTLAMLAAAALGGGCAAPFRCPAQGGPAWQELSSEHFTVSTDLEREDAEVALRDLEEYRAALMATAWPDSGDQAGGRLRVVILSRERDWRAFDKERDGLFAETAFEPFIALRAAASDQTRITIRHELTHYLSRLRIPRQPDWLAEGLATFFETIEYDRANGEVLIGLPLPSRMATLRANGFSATETMTGARKDQGTDRFYATSWLIVHYLISRQREPFARYLRALELGERGDSAWSAAFGTTLGPQDLQAELRGHWGSGRPLVASLPFRAPAFSMKARPLDDATVHALRALLYLGGLGKQAPPAIRDLARAEVDQALAADPSNLLAMAVLGLSMDQRVDLAAARAATRREPGNWLAWSILYRATGGDLRDPEGRRAAGIAARLGGENPNVRLPFGPARPIFARPFPPSPCRAAGSSDGGGAASQTASAEVPCPGGDRRDRAGRTADMRTVAGSDVGWCLFELPPEAVVEVTVDIDPTGQPSSVCAGRSRQQDPAAACVQRTLAGVSFPPNPDCTRRRRFRLAMSPDGRIVVSDR